MAFDINIYLTPLLNFLIPIGVVGVLCWIIYTCFRKPIDKAKPFFENLWDKVTGKSNSKDKNVKGIIYE